MAEHHALTEACAEATSAPDSEHVVPVLSLAYRRLLTEVLEPLLTDLTVQKGEILRGKGEEQGEAAGRMTVNDPPRWRSSAVAEVDKVLDQEDGLLAQ
jgi:hypothetical protein